MNSLERILATLQDQPTDRPALFLNAGLYGSRLTGASLQEHYSNAAAYAEGQLAVLETFSPDLLISPFVLAGLGSAFGSQLSVPTRQPPNVAVFAAESAEAALRLPIPDVDSHPGILYLRESIRLLAARCAGQVPVVGLLVSPVDMPPLIIGLEAWMDALLFQPEVARALLDRLTPFFAALGKAMFSDGATAVALTANLANRFMVPATVTETLTLPSLKQSLAELPGPVIFHHGGCPLLDQLASFKGLPNLVAFVVDAGEDLGAARRTLGPGPTLLGNLNGPGLADLRPEEVSDLCDRALAQRGGDRQFILATCCADIQLDTPPECITALTEAVCRAGGVEA